jgi:hypothetical protein
VLFDQCLREQCPFISWYGHHLAQYPMGCAEDADLAFPVVSGEIE